jgi:hypothetical protein
LENGVTKEAERVWHKWVTCADLLKKEKKKENTDFNAATVNPYQLLEEVENTDEDNEDQVVVLKRLEDGAKRGGSQDGVRDNGE